MSDQLDDLCVRMLCVGAHAEGTQNMRGSEIKALLVPFFGQERIDRCVRISCGEPEPVAEPVAEPVDA